MLVRALMHKFNPIVRFKPLLMTFSSLNFFLTLYFLEMLCNGFCKNYINMVFIHGCNVKPVVFSNEA